MPPKGSKRKKPQNDEAAENEENDLNKRLKIIEEGREKVNKIALDLLQAGRAKASELRERGEKEIATLPISLRNVPLRIAAPSYHEDLFSSRNSSHPPNLLSNAAAVSSATPTDPLSVIYDDVSKALAAQDLQTIRLSADLNGKKEAMNPPPPAAAAAAAA
eukprot:CAMPEP_0175046550 /NCGR_PEP_ID=MMETSP0052_2-20121109/5093_1 /TAXON_ID=51329 ORGANISM="Polytomella parva, Strain SAG 63-3" /NCGR_SAMPLE_ID=MMETSP0052_2 /ASSEMBLY_ACC=CAM_ASM_000194 /LENGTH=160 /DNA_ID=CAMNT_0016310309 /DNA_START=118 /DNA_END=597 /DNA_ORIENTATION=+